ncbi:hypothetical protein BJV74DRAFT_815602 [Russula compacta]|nr:hypothetical protein BJV74DRAFT_815602 [Russula compacta]
MSAADDPASSAGVSREEEDITEAVLSSRTRSRRRTGLAGPSSFGSSPCAGVDPSLALGCGVRSFAVASGSVLSPFPAVAASSFGGVEVSPALSASTGFEAAGSAVCKGETEVSPEVEVGSLATVASFAGTGGSAEVSAGVGR